MKFYCLFILATILLLFNIYMISLHEFVHLRLARLVSIGVFFLYYLISNKNRDTTLLLAFICFIIADVCLCFYENMYLNQLKFFFSILGYSLLIKTIYPNIIFKTINKFTYAILSIILICSISLIITALNMASHRLFGVFHEVLFCIYGLVLTILLLCNIAYNQSRISIFSNLALGFTTFFIVADVSLVIAYYLNRFDVFQIGSFFYLGGLTVFTIFSLSYSKSISTANIVDAQKIR